jgi:hypothetical protein
MGVNDNTSQIRLRDVVVADSGTTSAAFDLAEFVPVGVFIPSGLDGTTFGFTVANSAIDGTFVTLHDGTADISLTVAASKYIGFSKDLVERLKGVRFAKVVLSSQTGAITVTLHMLPRMWA